MSRILTKNDWPEDLELPDGYCLNHCLSCRENFVGLSRRVTCRKCYMDKKNMADMVELKKTYEQVLKACGEQFRFYQHSHLMKTPPDVEKASVNRQFAEMCEQAVRK